MPSSGGSASCTHLMHKRPFWMACPEVKVHYPTFRIQLKPGSSRYSKIGAAAAVVVVQAE